MLNKPKQLVIIGGGSSLSEGINKDLWKKLKGKFTIGTNYSYNFFNSSILCYVDEQFYKEESKKELFQNLSLIVGKEHHDLKVLPNTITLKCIPKYYRDVRLGCYKSTLAGLFSLSLGIYLLDEGEIYLLGFDYGNPQHLKDDKNRELTHFYQGKINHRGIGKTNYYKGIFNNKSRADKDFEVYKKDKKIKIYNVSITSKINTFIKMGYLRFFEDLDEQKFNQDELRKYIREKLK